MQKPIACCKKVKYETSLILILTVFVSFLATCKKSNRNHEDGIERQYYPNGNLSSEITYKDGMKNGPFKTWYENGILHSEANFKNDSIIGYSVSFYKNGNKNYERTRNGKYEFHGPSRFWYEDGTLGDSGAYQNGKLHGEWKKFYKNGELQSIINYNQSKLDGKCIFFDDNSDTLKVDVYRNGELIESKVY